MILVQGPIMIRLKLFLSSLQRRSVFSLAFRYKIVIASAVLLLLILMQLGSLKKDDSHVEIKIDNTPKKVKVKEYLDFDYKYDLKKSKDPRKLHDPLKDKNLPGQVEGLIADLSPPSVPKPAKRKSVERRAKTLNGIPLSPNHSEFDVIGSIDLYPSENIHQGYDEFAEDERKVVVHGEGEHGLAVNMSPKELAEGEKIMAKEAFNLVASDKMSLHRTVPDTRDPRCLDVKYDKVLPTTSVIIIFTNEAWTPLLRTIWSVLDKTPPEYLKEIILVDDFSDKKHLKGKLERYIQKKLPSKVRLKRLHKRSGLIRARLTGAKLATGDVLLFLDSHCECGDDWIQPLLQRIKDKPNAFVVPIIDVIDDKTMEYYHGNGLYFQIGGFTWNGHFNWIDIPEHENERRGSPVAPTRTPTMAGGLFAVDRNYFWHIGSYDEEMDVWGGENLEMSFRVWQCGGVLETIPCSRVGHIFRSFHPYTFPGNKDTHGINTARTVEVWMDDYKRLFYMNRPDLLSTEIGDVSARLKFKEEKQCKSFKWYLDNIFPQKFILDDPDHAFAYGRIKNPSGNVCFDTLQNDEKDSYDLGVYPCHDFLAASQFFSFSKQYQLRREDSCAEISVLAGANSEAVKMVPCVEGSEDQQWIHTKKGRLIHKTTNKCLNSGSDGSLGATDCKASQSQIWFFDNYIS